MTPEQFVYWLQGYAELTECAELTAKQWDMVKSHLALVLENRTGDKSDEYKRYLEQSARWVRTGSVHPEGGSIVSPIGGERLTC